MSGEGHGLSGVVAGHYRIERLLGIGGMGAVYRATDTRLRRTVAIKALLPELTADHRSLERFKREARMACRVSHPYVATVHDVVEHDDQLLIVMEYLEGRTLGAVLRDWQPSRDALLRWLLEIAEALAEIHRAGIVHRDVKPGNVMITEAGHAKLTDFGLARTHRRTAPDAPTVTGETALTGSGAAIGTPLYMSPEQLRGEAADPRSDQFAFGVLMYEGLTGTHPFTRPSMAESLSAILEAPPSGGETAPLWSSSPELRAVVTRALEKRPAARYEDSEQVLEALRTAVQSLIAPPARRLGWRLTAIGGGLVVAAVLGGIGLRAWLLQPPTWDRERYALAIAPFTVLAGDEEARLEAALLADLLTQDLQASRLIRVEGPDELKLAGLDPFALIRDLGVQTATARNVDYVLLGTLSRDGPRWRVKAEARPSREGLRELPPIETVGPGALELAESVAAAVRRRLPDVPRLTAMRDDRVDLERLTSSSEDARLAFERGSLALREGRLVDAIEALEQATAADPGFALAHARLADALDRTGDSRRARSSADAARDRLPDGTGPAQERMALTVQALRARIFANRDAWIEATGRLAERFPDEPAALAQQAEALLGVQQFTEALEVVDRAIQLDARNPELRLLRARILIDLERFDEAEAAFDEGETVYKLLGSREGVAEIEAGRGDLHVREDEDEVAGAAYARAAEIFRATGREISEAETWLAAQTSLLRRGRLEEAAARIDDAERLARASGNHRLLSSALNARAVYHYLQRDWDGAIEFYRQAVDAARFVENTALKLPPLGNLASLLVWLQRADEALPLLEEFEAGAADLGMREARQVTRINRAELALQLGDVAGAVAGYEGLLEAIGDETSQTSLLSHMGLASLHRERGRYALALDLLDRAIDQARSLEAPANLGRALSNRARVLSALGRDEQADQDLAELTRLGRTLPDLGKATRRTRAWLAFHRGRWKAALDLATADPSDTSPVARLQACAAAVRAASDRALRLCAAALDEPATMPPERAEAEAWLGLARLRVGDRRAALEAARAAIEAGTRMDLPLPLALGAATVAGIPPDERPDDAERLMEAGRRALETLLDAAPPADRDRLRERPDFRILRDALNGSVAAADHSNR